jgi:predicted HNH restriction endonuclease
MKNIRDKKFLKTLARGVHTGLLNRRLGYPFRIKGKFSIRSTNSDGWSATIGTFSGYQCYADIWLDRFTAHPRRKIYYCLYSPKKDGLAELAKAAQNRFGKHLSIYLKHWDQNSPHCRLAKQLAKARFGHPIYERYPGNREFFYGIYEYDRTGLQRNEIGRLQERVVEFFQTVVESVSRENPRPDYETYEGEENRQSVVRHVRRERRSYAATLRKQQDNYICQVCRFDFSKYYGALGNDVAEAHHIVPLNTNHVLRRTTIDDLITVCANCHRILHKMKGRPGDLKALRRIIRSKKR